MAVTLEEIRGVTWDLQVAGDGEDMPNWMIVRRLAQSPFWAEGPNVVLNMFAITQGESGGWLKAYHLNVEREPADANGHRLIKRYPPLEPGGPDRMKVKSVDMGLMQINIVLPVPMLIDMTTDAITAWMQKMYSDRPDLARADESIEIAWQKYKNNKAAGGTGYGPWYAYQPGTDRWRMKKRYGSQAVAEFLLRDYVGKVDATGHPSNYYPRLEFVR